MTGRIGFIGLALIAAWAVEVRAASDALKADPAYRSAQSESNVVASPSPERQFFQTETSAVRVYGDWLFRGNFASQSLTGFNPDYSVSVGDMVDVRLWGALDYEASLKVDPQGNIFVPKVGPVRMLNVKNGDLTRVIEASARRVFRESVGVYASLQAAQQVKIFVSGFVRNPGLYTGYSADSVLKFLDMAGGISSGSGSYIDVRLLRGGVPHRAINLYGFLLNGEAPLAQLRDGDVIFVGPLQKTVRFLGLAEIPAQVEFSRERPTFQLGEALKMVRPSAAVTHAKVVSNIATQRSSVYLPLAEATQYELSDGDEVELVADRQQQSIVVDVGGEHLGQARYVLPYGATVGDLLAQLKPSPESEMTGLQLFRKSLAQRQKYLLEESLRTLESSVLAARSGTEGEASLRLREAELILKFVERARQVEPRGQVILSGADSVGRIALEDGDQIRIPRKSQLVSVQGEVYFANVFAYREGSDAMDYVRLAGGFTQNADSVRLLVMHQGGDVEIDTRSGFFSAADIKPGDEIMVLPEVNVKSFQISKDIVEVIYQIAVATRAVVGL